MSRLRAALVMTALALVLPCAGVSAQEPSLQDDPIFAALFPPDLIMQHRSEIGLTDEQRDAISRLLQDVEGRVRRMQRELVDQMRQLTDNMKATRVDLDRALDQLDKVLDTEKRIKQANLEMLIRIKNLLSADQQAALARFQDGGAR